jgi:hypothetical protein
MKEMIAQASIERDAARLIERGCPTESDKAGIGPDVSRGRALRVGGEHRTFLCGVAFERGRSALPQRKSTHPEIDERA